MTNRILILILSLFLISCDSEKPEVVEDDLVGVYIEKSDTQCNDDGLSLVEVSSYLSTADIEVNKAMCGFITGISYDTVCGGGTNNIYYFSINAVDLTQAENLGFTALSSLDSGLSYEAKECL